MKNKLWLISEGRLEKGNSFYSTCFCSQSKKGNTSAVCFYPTEDQVQTESVWELCEQAWLPECFCHRAGASSRQSSHRGHTWLKMEIRGPWDDTAVDITLALKVCFDKDEIWQASYFPNAGELLLKLPGPIRNVQLWQYISRRSVRRARV